MSLTRLTRRRVLAGLVSVPAVATLGTTPDPAAGQGVAEATEEGVAALQTAMTVENALVDMYPRILGLTAIAEPGEAQRLRSLLVLWRDHHRAHSQSLGKVLADFGAAEQPAANVAVAQRASRVLDASGDPATVLAMAAELEEICGQTHLRNLALVAGVARELTASIMGVEFEHASLMRLATRLAETQSIGLLDPGADLTGIPEGAVAASLGGAVQASDQARPATEGRL